MTQLKNKKKSRAGYKGYLSYAFPEVNKCLKDYTEDIKNEIERWKEALRIFIFARLLIKLARLAIAGFSLTSVNYKAATGLLKRSYGKRTAIQRTHIKDLMNIEPIYSERDARWLRALCDFAEIKHRALEPLGVTRKHTPPSWCHHCWRNFQSSFV